MVILLENASVVTLNTSKPVLEGQRILIHKGVIVEMGRQILERRLPITRRIDCSQMIVMPGMVNSHSHLTEILQKRFRDNMRMEIWRGYRAMTEDLANLKPDEIGTAAELACSEMLKNGVTAVVDHFSTRPGLSVDKMEAILGAFEKTGIRGMLVPSLRDQDFIRLVTRSPSNRNAAKKESPEPWKEAVLAVVARLRRASTLSGIMLGPSSPMNCSDGLLREVVKVDGKVVLESGRLIGVDEEALIRRVEPISKKMHRLYGLVQKKPDRSQRVIRDLYRKSFLAKGLASHRVR